MQENYKCLGIFNFGKRCYVVLSNNGKIKYFEKINGEYVMPITSFNLFDNEGKSLTHVNQHFFMKELVDRLNDAFKKKIFVVDEECINYLNDLINKISNDDILKKLFKGSNMKEINEYNFELNKKEIIDYLNKFRFDTFVNYNNVSIFNGEIEKNADLNVSNNEEAPVFEHDLSFNANNTDIDSNNINFSDNINVSFDNINENIESVSSDDYFSSMNNSIVENTNQNTNNIQNPVSLNSVSYPNVGTEFGFGADLLNPFENNVINQDNNNVLESVSLNNGSDSNVGTEFGFGADIVNPFEDSNISNQNNNNVLESASLNNESDSNVGTEFGFGADIVNSFEDSNISNQNNNNVLESVSLNNESDSNVGTEFGFGTEVVNPFEDSNISNQNTNNVQDSIVENNLVNQFNVNSNLSYIDQVKSRIENNNPQFGAIVNNNLNSLNNINFGNEMGSDNVVSSPIQNSNVITDNNELPDLESVDSENFNDKKIEKKKTGKSRLALIFILIILVLVLAFVFVYDFVL